SLPFLLLSIAYNRRSTKLRVFLFYRGVSQQADPCAYLKSGPANVSLLLSRLLSHISFTEGRFSKRIDEKKIVNC
ncbi:hypothetical protein BOX15_Mlig015642g1, partial [Macrostomum lignano]